MKNKNLKHINLSILKDNVGEEEEFLKEMILSFLDSYPIYLKEFIEADKSGNQKEVQYMVHKMKSSLKLFGAEEGGEVGDYIEESIICGSPLDLNKEIKRFIEISNSVIQELKSILK